MTLITAELLVTAFFKVTKERIVSFYRLKEIAKEYERSNEGVQVDYTKASLRKAALGNPNLFMLEGDYIITRKKDFESSISEKNRMGRSIAEINAKLLA